MICTMRTRSDGEGSSSPVYVASAAKLMWNAPWERRSATPKFSIISSLRGAINGLMGEVLEDHIRLHVADMTLDRDMRYDGADELIDVVQTYLK